MSRNGRAAEREVRAEDSTRRRREASGNRREQDAVPSPEDTRIGAQGKGEKTSA